MSYRYALDLQLFSGEKTEKATPKKRQESRKKGEVAKSQDLSGAVVLVSSFLTLLAFGGYFKKRLLYLYTDVFYHKIGMEVTKENVMTMFTDYAIQLLLLLAPIFLVILVMALLANYVQVGFLISGEPLKMKLSKLDPIKGFKNLFSMRALVQFLITLLKLLIIGYLVYSTIWGERDKIAMMGRISIDDAFEFTAHLTMSLGLKIGAALFVLAILDFIYKKYEHAKNLKMSKQDIKDEYKKMEGDPLIKGKIRERQRRIAFQRMMQEVPKADVIITNPTHFAVALKYDGSNMEAPEVVAKGQDYIALRIKEIAKEHGVVTVENKPLARALYKRTEIGDSIPGDLFQAVAEVLAYVYKLKGKAK